MSRPEFPIIDLHCDLLAYLWLGEIQKLKRSAHDECSRAAIPQLKRGGVKVQTLAIFVLPKRDATRGGEIQTEIFARMLEREQDHVRPISSASDLESSDERIGLIAALEGGSTFAEEDEPLDRALERFDAFEKRLGRILYVSLTWNHETRFGGGNTTKTGLKADGRVLLEYLSGRGIAVDLSHTSHALADGILDTIYAKDLDIPVLASHSNFAALNDLPRNLPPEIAAEIIRRDGVIGINFLLRFLGSPAPEGMIEQFQHARQIGGGKHSVFGADFFYDQDVPAHMRRDDQPDFADDFGDASCYPRLLDQLGDQLKLDREAVEDLAWRNAQRFMTRVLKAS